VEPAATDRIQRMIDAEATGRFPPDAVPRLVLLRYGDHPVIEPGELYLLVIPGQDGGTWDAWMDEHFDRLEAALDEQVKEHFPDGGVRWIALLQHGDDPSVEPGDLLARVLIQEAGENPNLRAWDRDHETMIRELQHELAEQLPGASHLEFWFGENGRQGKSRHRLGSRPDDPARSEQDLTLADIRLGPADLEMLDALITTGTAASRAEAVGWILAHIRERPAFARLTERARELDELKAHF
jgi:hypothetical protein